MAAFKLSNVGPLERRPSLDSSRHTPWGRAQYAVRYARGITFYGTSEHGGFFLSPTVNAAMPDASRIASGWYEEDCDYARVFLAFPEIASVAEHVHALRSLKNYFPDVARALGHEVALEESYMLQRRAAEIANAGRYVGVAGSGDWHEAVPKGLVSAADRMLEWCQRVRKVVEDAERFEAATFEVAKKA